MPLDIPLVPVNSDVKVAAMSALVQSIGDLQKFQSAPSGGAATSEAQKKAAKDDADAKERARKDALSDQSEKRNLFGEQNNPQASSGLSGLQSTEQGNEIPVGDINSMGALGSVSSVPVY